METRLLHYLHTRLHGRSKTIFVSRCIRKRLGIPCFAMAQIGTKLENEGLVVKDKTHRYFMRKEIGGDRK
jgi:hypothetical protein